MVDAIEREGSAVPVRGEVREGTGMRGADECAESAGERRMRVVVIVRSCVGRRDGLQRREE